jgi:V/A-type H+-transporting ATPase subunit C
MPRVAIENLKLIEIDDLINLIGKDFEAIRSTLADSPYAEQILATSQDTLNYSFLETALLENYAETMQKIIKFSSGNIKKLLLALLRKVEVSNLKTMLRAAKGHIDVDEAMKHMVPVGILDLNRCRAILEAAASIEDVIAALSNFEYGKVLNHAIEERGENLKLLEVALDKAVYREILETVKKLTGVDQKIAYEMIGIELDAINVKIILKGKKLSVSPEIVKEYLMPTAFLNETILEKAVAATDVKSMIERLSMTVEWLHPVYKKVFTQMLKESNAQLSWLETILDKAPIEMSLSVLKEHSRYYNIAFILAFLNLRWAEVKNLRCIVKGSERKSPHSQVRKLLIIPDEWQKPQLISRPS